MYIDNFYQKGSKMVDKHTSSHYSALIIQKKNPSNAKTSAVDLNRLIN